MKAAQWILMRLLAGVLGVAGGCAALYIGFAQGDTGGAVAVGIATCLVCSIVLNE
jgi:hypothetical protein